MSSSAQRDAIPEPDSLFVSAAVSAADLKQFAAERLAAHRSRRAPNASTQAAAEALPPLEARMPGAARIRDAVAARYQQSPSYQEFLTSETEIAASAAESVEVEAAPAQPLEEPRAWPQQEPSQPEPEAAPPAALSVRLPEEIAPRSALPAPPPPEFVDPTNEAEEIHELDQEIAFRLAPEFAEHHIEPLPLPANILEFPRQLVASRKARPRLAEGPLREDPDSLNTESQLRIFEVEPEAIATAPEPFEPEAFTDIPEWQSLQLDASPRQSPYEALNAALDAVLGTTHDFAEPVEAAPWNPATSAIYTQPVQNAPLQTAHIPRRLLSGVTDACCLAAAWVGLVCLAFVAAGPSLAHLTHALLGALAAASALALYISYHLLFFTFADATPGMRYAHLDFCTFDNENPTRSAMRRRIWLTLLAACPLGLGLLWMAMDYDHLGWHDRMSKMYPREY
jgi:uncharacterized RDD family membrane protein YckC